MKNFFRHEQKYICSHEQIIHLRELLCSLLPYDEYATNGSYHIKSLYFDTYNDCFLMESINGLPRRKKYRIRSYNNDINKFKLECKESCFNMKRKQFVSISNKDVQALIDGHFDKDIKIFEDFYCLQKTELLQPKIVIDYDRTAFVDQGFNTRITLDTNITASKDHNSFLKAKTDGKHIINAQTGILEVKYNSSLPDYMINLLRLESLEQTSFSKYVNGRMAVEPSFSRLK